jgi:hypothetical protein
MKIEKGLLCFLCVLLLLGLGWYLVGAFSMEAPSSEEGKVALQSWFDRTYPGICEIVAFKKLDDRGNSRHVVLYYDATVEILKDTDGLSSDPYGFHIEDLTEGFAGWADHSPRHQPRKGERFHIHSADISFKKADRGWAVEHY